MKVIGCKIWKGKRPRVGKPIKIRVTWALWCSLFSYGEDISSRGAMFMEVSLLLFSALAALNSVLGGEFLTCESSLTCQLNLVLISVRLLVSHQKSGWPLKTDPQEPQIIGMERLDKMAKFVENVRPTPSPKPDHLRPGEVTRTRSRGQEITEPHRHESNICYT